MNKRLTINMTDDQHAQLVVDAGNRTLSDYGREKLFGKEGRAKKRIRKPKTEDVMLARILMALGSSDIAASMRDIAAAARNGALPESPDVVLQIQAACLTIEKIRTDLIRGLGIKPDG